MNSKEFSYDEVDAAMCLWEECIRRQGVRDDDLFHWLADGEGACAARDRCIDLARYVEHSYQVARAFRFDDSFDWEFVPVWADIAMEVTQEHPISPVWSAYIGYKVTALWRESYEY